MDEAVKTTLLAAALALGAAPAMAQALADPTRPPAVLTAPAPGAAVAASPAGPVLQSVLIGRAAGGRQVAVIDGETVRLGESFRGAVLVRMTDTEVELKRGRARQVLKLSAPAGTTTNARSK